MSHCYTYFSSMKWLQVLLLPPGKIQVHQSGTLVIPSGFPNSLWVLILSFQVLIREGQRSQCGTWQNNTVTQPEFKQRSCNCKKSTITTSPPHLLTFTMILLKHQQQPGLKKFYNQKKKRTTLHKYNGIARLNVTLEQIQLLLLLFLTNYYV